jgi:hypothetical protein
MTPPKPDPRRHARILRDPQHPLRCEGAPPAPKINGTVTVIGLGGMFVRTARLEPFGPVPQLRVHNLVTFVVARTVRSVSGKGVGVEFTSMARPEEKKRKNLLLHLRPQPSN